MGKFIELTVKDTAVKSFELYVNTDDISHVYNIDSSARIHLKSGHKFSPNETYQEVLELIKNS